MRLLENKIPPPVLTVLTGAVMYAASTYTNKFVMDPIAQGLAITAVMVIAGFFGIRAIRLFNQTNTTIDPVHIENASSLVTTGIYQITRNPMYVSLTLMLCAWAIWLASPLQLIGPIFFAVFINRYQIIPEERMMSEKFDSEYEDYKSKVRRWL